MSPCSVKYRSADLHLHSRLFWPKASGLSVVVHGVNIKIDVAVVRRKGRPNVNHFVINVVGLGGQLNRTQVQIAKVNFSPYIAARMTLLLGFQFSSRRKPSIVL